jgi:hypothetical protein
LEKANENQTALLACLNEAAHDRKRKLELATAKMGIVERNNKFNRRLQIALASNNTDELTLLLEEAKSGLDDEEGKQGSNLQ